MKKTLLIIALLTLLILNLSFAQKVIYQNWEVTQILRNNSTEIKIHNVYSSLYASKVDETENGKPIYTTLTFFENYPKLTQFLIDHQNKTYSKKVTDLNNLKDPINDKTSQIAKMLKVKKTKTQTQINQKNVEAIEYSFYVENFNYMNVTLVDSKQIFSKEDLEFYQKINNTPVLKITNPFHSLKIYEDLNKKVAEGYIIAGFSWDNSKYIQTLKTIKVINGKQDLFSIPQNYKQIN